MHILYYYVAYFHFPSCYTSQLSKNYGPVFSVRLGTTKVVVLSGYKTVHDALLRHGNEFCERPVYPLIENHGLNNGTLIQNEIIWLCIFKKFLFCCFWLDYVPLHFSRVMNILIVNLHPVYSSKLCHFCDT